MNVDSTDLATVRRPVTQARELSLLLMLTWMEWFHSKLYNATRHGIWTSDSLRAQEVDVSAHLRADCTVRGAVCLQSAEADQPSLHCWYWL